jgi:hypothetical protein
MVGSTAHAEVRFERALLKVGDITRHCARAAE